MKHLFKNLAAQAKSGRFRFRADVDKADLEGESSSKTGGLKVMTVVIFVLAAHIVVIGGITAYNLLKGPPKDTAQAPAPEALSPDGSSAATADAPAKADGADVAKDQAAPAKDGTAAPMDSNGNGGEAISLAPAPATGDASEPAVTTAAPVPSQPAMATTAAAAPAKPVPAAALQTPTGAFRKDYVVKSGDNLHKIATSHGMTVAELKSMNGLKGDTIRVGQKLAVTKGGAPAAVAVAAAVPAAPVAQDMTAAAAPAPAPVAVAAAPAAGQTYKVAKGDTLTRIAKQFNTSAAAIMAANKLADPKKLKIGEVLVIPGRSDRREVSSQQQAPSVLPNQPKTNPDLVMNK